MTLFEFFRIQLRNTKCKELIFITCSCLIEILSEAVSMFSDLGLGDGGAEQAGEEEDGGDHERFLEAMASLDGKKK